jgi:S-adenosylmethionine:tRNA ribosyltransferase-isomerase
MRVDDFDYYLPESLIAQDAIEPRDAARLLVADAASVADQHCRDLTNLLRPGDCLVLNTTRVFPARLYGTKSTGGHIECLLLHPVDPEHPQEWQCLMKGKVHVGSEVTFVDHDGPQTTQVIEVKEDGSRVIAFPEGFDVWALTERIGSLPLPPYIKRADTATDRERYQTVFAGQAGSVAAPTAGLHFTTELLQSLKELGINRADVELHVGPGTFKPVQADDVNGHHMHSEWFHAPARTIEQLRQVREQGGRVIAVGTTVARTLHAVWSENDWHPNAGWTDTFLHPPKRLPAIDGLMTNFHLPRSTLLMLVACGTGIERLHALYQHAVAEKYRFYSYGDAMLLLNQPGMGA